jgi:NTE family protein
MPDENSSTDVLKSPVRAAATPAEKAGPETGIALCLSGGGFRAMLFHVGSLWRLNEAGFLGGLKRVSSVSGGSITAAVLGMNWQALGFVNGSAPAGKFQSLFVNPIRALADRTIDVKSVIMGAILPGFTISDRVAAAYDKFLFQGRTLSDLPDDTAGEGPRFVLNATNVQTGSLWRFSQPYMGDYRVGLWPAPKLKLSVAVAASSAFPPVLSPCLLDLDDAPDPNLTSGKLPELGMPPYTHRVVLSDGGVYDNLGLETAFKRYTALLVSDGGMKMSPDPEPHEDWGLHSKRILELVDNQVRSLRKRQLIEAYTAGVRAGAYWGIATHLEDYKLLDAAGKPDDRFGYLAAQKPWWKDTADLASTPTRLAAVDSSRQEALIDWGYVVCDAALRAHASAKLEQAPYNVKTQPAAGLPYPNPS